MTKEREHDVLLKVHLPGKQTTVITVPPRLVYFKYMMVNY